MNGVLVTCAARPPGPELCRTLAARAPVLACGPERESGVAKVLEDGGIRYLPLDLRHSRNRRSLLFGAALDAHVEAVVHTPSCEAQHPHAAADTLRELIHLCQRHPTIRQFVYLGTAEVYRSAPSDPAVIDEEHPVEAAAGAPQCLHDLVEADQAACAHIGASRLRVAVLRSPELFAPGSDGQLRRWLRSDPCLTPLGFDPMVELIGSEDLVRAIALALRGRVSGVFNVPGADRLPLSALAAKMGRRCLPLPGWLLGPAYRLRSLAGPSFDYPTNEARFHFGGVLCGRAALATFGYQPRSPIRWAQPGVSVDAPVNTVRLNGATKPGGPAGSVLEARA